MLLLRGYTNYVPYFSQDVRISLFDAKTLFHELGHAVHLCLANTKYHHMSGTRGEVDFVEFPSSLFESLLFDKTLLDSFGEKFFENSFGYLPISTSLC